MFDCLSKKNIFKDDNLLSRYTKEGFIDFKEERCSSINSLSLNNNWKNKWDSFNNVWNKERQKYRFLYDAFKFFHTSFEQLTINKLMAINELNNREKENQCVNISATALYGMYYHGKKCIDLLKKLKLINEDSFINKFSETRNKLIEHNFNPNNLNLQIDPQIWSLTATNSFMKIWIHENDKKERRYDAYIDYYEDYFLLGKILKDIISSW